MRHEVTTMNTRRALADALKRAMEKKPLAKISVSELTADCGMNRKTFYYHFSDIYTLLQWMLEEEAIKVVEQFDLLVDYREAVLFAMDYVRRNKHLLCCAYDSMGREEMKRFFYADFIGISQRIVSDMARELGVQPEENFEEFLAHFYAEGIAGLLIDEFTARDSHDPQLAAEYISRILKSSLPAVLMSAGAGTP